MRPSWHRYAAVGRGNARHRLRRHVYDATGFTDEHERGQRRRNASGTFNEFEGCGGNDTITGNGNTRISYRECAGWSDVVMTGVGAGTSRGTDAGDIAGVGIDTFTGVNTVRGSDFADMFSAAPTPRAHPRISRAAAATT